MNNLDDTFEYEGIERYVAREGQIKPKFPHPKFRQHPLKWTKYQLVEKPVRDETARRIRNYRSGNGKYPSRLKTISHAFIKGALPPKDQIYHEIKDHVGPAQYTADNASWCFGLTTAAELGVPYAATHLLNYFFPGANVNLSETFNLVHLTQRLLPPYLASLATDIHITDALKYLFDVGVVANGSRWAIAKFAKKRSFGIGIVAAGILIGNQIKKSRDKRKNKLAT